MLTEKRSSHHGHRKFITSQSSATTVQTHITVRIFCTSKTAQESKGAKSTKQ